MRIEAAQVAETPMVVTVTRLRDVARQLEALLAVHAPDWAGYGASIAEIATELLEREPTVEDVGVLRDSVYGPFRGTFGSMHDLSFLGDVEDRYQALRSELGRALDGLISMIQQPRKEDG